MSITVSLAQVSCTFHRRKPGKHSQELDHIHTKFYLYKFFTILYTNRVEEPTWEDLYLTCKKASTPQHTRG